MLDFTSRHIVLSLKVFVVTSSNSKDFLNSFTGMKQIDHKIVPHRKRFAIRYLVQKYQRGTSDVTCQSIVVQCSKEVSYLQLQ